MNIFAKKSRKHKQDYPFRVVYNPEVGYYVTLGECILSDAYATQEEAEACIDMENWNFLITVISAVGHINNKIDNFKKQTNGN